MEMYTLEQWEKFGELIIAHKRDGKKIEYYNPMKNKWITTYPQWTLGNKYRIAPEPELIPFDFSDAEKLIGKAVKFKHRDEPVYLITCVTDKGVCFCTDFCKYSDFLEDFTFLDGSPCGKLKC